MDTFVTYIVCFEIMQGKSVLVLFLSWRDKFDIPWQQKKKTAICITWKLFFQYMEKCDSAKLCYCKNVSYTFHMEWKQINPAVFYVPIDVIQKY